MRKVTKHVTIPLILPAVFFVVASLPIELIGCRNRGLLAGSLALAAGVLGVVAAGMGLAIRLRGDSNSFLWMATAIILAVPAIVIVLIAY